MPNIVCHFINTNQHITLVRLKINGAIDTSPHQGTPFANVEYRRSPQGGSDGQRQVPEPLLRHPGKQDIGGGRATGPESGPYDTVAVAPPADPNPGIQASDPKHPGSHKPELDWATAQSLANGKIKIDIQTRYSFFIISYLLSRQN